MWFQLNGRQTLTAVHNITRRQYSLTSDLRLNAGRKSEFITCITWNVQSYVPQAEGLDPYLSFQYFTPYYIIILLFLILYLNILLHDVFTQVLITV
jgi:hypothetical protein